MGKKNKTIVSKSQDKRVYPIKVRLAKPNPMNRNKVVVNDIEICTYKDTIIESAEQFAKIISLQNLLVVKSDVAESNVEVVESEGTIDMGSGFNE